jgi:tetratricopeptide (TPR) repeat protein
MVHVFLLWSALVVMQVPAPPAQPPFKGQNLQHFPKDISRDALVQKMREFSFALGVRCEYCHVGDPKQPMNPALFALDDKPAKLKARAMLKMVDQLNGPMLAALPARSEPRVVVECTTCHRGLPLPKTLQTTLLEIVNKDGSAAAVAKYRDLRTNQTLSGRYNFGEWEINELARRLHEAGKVDDAIAILEMNGEFYPKSPDIDFTIAEMYLRKGDKEKAIARYKATLDKAPNYQPAKQRLAEIDKQ